MRIFEFRLCALLMTCMITRTGVYTNWYCSGLTFNRQYTTVSFNLFSFDKAAKGLLVSLVSAYLVGCSSSSNIPSPQTQKTKTPNQQQKPVDTPAPSSASKFQSPQEQAIEQAYLAMQAGLSKAEIAKHIFAIKPDMFYSISADIKLAQVYLQLEQLPLAEQIISRLKRGALPSKHQISLWLVSAQLDAAKGQNLDSIRTLFRLSQLYGLHLSERDKRLNNELIWQNILALPAESLTPFQSDFGQEVDSWIQLAQILQSFAKRPHIFGQQVQNWTRAHAQQALLPQQVIALTQVQPFKPKHIAIALPFSGKRSKEALTIRDGILAAAALNSDVSYSFIDTQKLSVAQVEQLVQQQQIDFIIGPLLKETVQNYQQSSILSAIAQLNLNMPTSEQLQPSEQTAEQKNTQHFYFALSPEDEVTQAVEYFVAKGIKHPAVIYANNSLGRRLHQQFEQLWQTKTDSELESIAFENKSKLGEAVKALLDVDISAKRIAQIEQLFGAKIKSEERSRTDIDAIYVIANSQQTRLIKPFFDVNVSIFGNSLPIYASSRSYVIDETRSQKLDLNGLSFTQMPWLLAQTGNDVSDLYQQIGENNTQLKKLFAFGYDAHKLVPLLPYLTVLKETSVNALTGELTLTEGNQISRQLTWAQYKQGQIIVVKTLN